MYVEVFKELAYVVPIVSGVVVVLFKWIDKYYDVDKVKNENKILHQQVRNLKSDLEKLSR